MTLDKQVAAKLAFEPGDKKKLEEIWVTVERTINSWGKTAKDPIADIEEIKHCKVVAREAFNQAYLDHGIKGPLATTALAAVGL